MQSLSVVVASNVVLAAVLALLALTVTRLWKNPHLAHALWLLVLIKLVTPPFVTVDVPEQWIAADQEVVSPDSAPSLKVGQGGLDEPAIGSRSRLEDYSPLQTTSLLPLFGSGEEEHDAARPETVSILEAAVLLPLEELEPPWPEYSAEENLNVADPAPTAVAENQAAARNAERTAPANRTSADTPRWPAIVALFWVVGVAVSAVVTLRRCMRFRNVVAESLPADDRLLEEAARLAARIGLKRSPPVRVVAARIPPLVWCCGLRPLVLLPRELLAAMNPAQRRAVLAHELAHVRRHDHLVRWLEVLVLAACWWNPLAWFARRRLRQAEEECCDAHVVWALPESRRSYGQALLRTIEFLTERRPLPAVAGSPFGGFPFRRRIEMILNQRSARRMSWTAWAFVLTTAACVLPVAAQTQDDEAAAEPTAPAAEPVAASAATIGPSALPAAEPAATVAAEPATPPPAAPETESRRASVTSSQPTSTTGRLDSRFVQTVFGSGATASTAEPAASTGDRRSLEERIARLERLVEALVESRRTSGQTQSTSPQATQAPRSSDSQSQQRTDPDSFLVPAAETRRLAISREGGLAAILTVGHDRSLIVIHDVESSRVLSMLQVGGRASEIRFTEGGDVLSVKVGDEWKSYPVPDGWELRELPAGNPSAGQPPAGGAASSQPSSLSPLNTPVVARAAFNRLRAERQALYEAARAKLAGFLAEWTPQERLLRIDLDQAELKLEAARLKWERSVAANEKASGAVASDEIDELKFAVRQAELDVARASTKLDLHQAQRNAAEDEAKQVEAHLRSSLEEFVKRYPGDPEASNLLDSFSQPKDGESPARSRR